MDYRDDSSSSLAAGRRKVITDKLPSVIAQSVEGLLCLPSVFAQSVEGVLRLPSAFTQSEEGLLRFLRNTNWRTPEIPLVNREAPSCVQVVKNTAGRKTLPPAHSIMFGKNMSDESGNFTFPDGWPDSWSGNTVIDTGTAGKFCCELITDASPHIGHIENYKAILAHMGQIWPLAYDYIYSTSREWEIARPLRNPGVHLQITLPTESIEDGAEWSISAQWDNSATWFNAQFRGWEFNAEDSQPYN